MHKLSKALTFMGAILALTFCAVSCKTDDDDEPTMYTVTVSDSLEHGKVTADKSSAEAGATVKLTATADSGYELDSYSVKDEKSNTITVTEGTFTMPKSNVTVSATFKETTVTPQKTAGSISYATTTVSKTTAAEPFTNELTKTGDGTVSYTSDNTAVATVNEDGEVTIKGAGEATITATVADSDTYTYATKTASYTLTVKQPVTLKTGGDINSILGSLCADNSGYPACTKFARSETNNEKATLYLDTEGKYIPVWSVDTEVYYYVPDGCTPVMNEDSSKMFYYCFQLTSLDVDGFDTSNVTNMSYMFGMCSGLKSLDVTGFDTSKVTNMSYMFVGCSGLASLDVSNFDTSKVSNMWGMFARCSGLASLDVTGFDTSNVTNMSYMFDDCSGLKSLDVTGFDTSNVTNMSVMFSGCSGLKSLDVTGFATSNVTDMSSMFCGCSGLTSLDVTGFDTSNVTDMSGMFSGCSGLTSLDVTGFDTSNVTDMSFMFSECSNLTSLDLSKFDTGNVTDMEIMFYKCSNLTSLDLSSFDTSNVTDMEEMFSGCEVLTKIYATDKFVTTNVTSGDYCFDQCSKLVGGAGTTFDASDYEKTLAVPYARIDGGPDAPGYFTLKPIGSKSKPDAVGDIVFSDGSATAYTSELTNEQKSKAVAVIFYAGSASDTLGAKTLGVGLVQETGLAWATGEFGCGTEFATSDTDGSGNWDVIVDAANKLTGVAADAAQMEVGTAATGFPAFNFANTYGVSVAGEESGWYLPAKEELQNLYESYSISGSAVKKALEKCTGTIDLSTGYFWSSSQYASNGTKAYNLNFSNGVWYDHVKTATNRYVCAVRAF